MLSLSCNAVSKEQNTALLYEKYPEIAFLYSCWNNDSASRQDAKPCLIMKHLPSYDDVEMLFVFGLCRGMTYEYFKPFLQKNAQKKLVIMESELQEIDALMEEDQAKDLLSDPQVQLLFATTHQQWLAIFDHMALSQTTDRVELIASPFYQKKGKRKIASLRLALLRKVALYSCLFTEGLHYHLLSKNLLRNFDRVLHSCYVNALDGSCANMPAIICGAGPSLSTVVDELKTLGHSALIFGCGTAITALSKYGVKAHINIALDPNHEEYVRLKESQGFETPFAFSCRVNSSVFDTFNAPMIYMSSDTGGALEDLIEDSLHLTAPPIGADLSCESLSVTTMAVSLARRMGCSPIILCGVDLAFTSGKRYADDVMHPFSQGGGHDRHGGALDKHLTRKDLNGKPTSTLVKWIMEAKSLSSYAKKHGSIPFYRGTNAGIEIPHISFTPLSTVIKDRASHDIKGWLHAMCQMHRIEHASSYLACKKEIYESLQRSCDIVTKILEELAMQRDSCHLSVPSARQTVFEMDLAEEVAFQRIFAATPVLLERLLSRKYPTIPYEDSHELCYLILEKEKSKWMHMQKIIMALLDSFDVKELQAHIP
jgi:hypothetical protein